MMPCGIRVTNRVGQGPQAHDRQDRTRNPQQGRDDGADEQVNAATEQQVEPQRSTGQQSETFYSRAPPGRILILCSYSRFVA